MVFYTLFVGSEQSEINSELFSLLQVSDIPPKLYD
jgi:hypothetical protein